MPFGMVSGVGRGMGALDRGGNRQREWVVLGANLGECGLVAAVRALPKLFWGGLVIHAGGSQCVGGVMSCVCLSALVKLKTRSSADAEVDRATRHKLNRKNRT